MRYLLVPVACVAFASCAGEKTAKTPRPEPEARPVASAEARPDQIIPVPGRKPRRTSEAVAVLAGKNTEADAALARSLAAAFAANALGVMTTTAQARREAGRGGADSLVLCQVVEYHPYDPSRLIVKVTLYDVAAQGMTAADVSAMVRSPTVTSAGRGDDSGTRRKIVSVDAADEKTLNDYAYRRLGDKWGSPQDLLEAEILLRDPLRFFPFAAQLVAEAVRSASGD